MTKAEQGGIAGPGRDSLPRVGGDVWWEGGGILCHKLSASLPSRLVLAPGKAA